MIVVLTVEDEIIVSVYLGEVLREASYTVLATSNADEAIGMLESRDDIRLVITDIDMPGSMDGLKLTAAIRWRWPPIKLIVTTAKAPPADEQLPINSLFVPKPYMPDDIMAAVRHLRPWDAPIGG